MADQTHLSHINTITFFYFSVAPPFDLIFLFTLFKYKGHKFVLKLIRCLCYAMKMKLKQTFRTLFFGVPHASVLHHGFTYKVKLSVIQ